jgi:hypothetical protein
MASPEPDLGPIRTLGGRGKAWTHTDQVSTYGIDGSTEPLVAG